MKNIVNNQHGVTLIETVAATAIIAIIMVTVLGALLYGQKMIIFTDTKNNAAAQAQDLVDGIMTQLGAGTPANAIAIEGAIPVDKDTGFADQVSATDVMKQYIIIPVTIKKMINEKSVDFSGYNIFVRVYYNNGDSYVDLKAFAKKGGAFN